MFRKSNMEDVIWQRDRIQQDSSSEFYMDAALANPNSIDLLDSQTLEQTNPNSTSHSPSSSYSCFNVFGSCMSVFKYPIENETLTRQARNAEKHSSKHFSLNLNLFIKKYEMNFLIRLESKRWHF